MIDRLILFNQYIPTGCGFKLVKIVEDASSRPMFSKNDMPHYADIKGWCKQNCSGIWAHSTRPFTVPVSNNWKDGHNTVNYLAFVDQIDITAVGYYMGLQHFKSNVMWPSTMTFNIYFPSDS